MLYFLCWLESYLKTIGWNVNGAHFVNVSIEVIDEEPIQVFCFVKKPFQCQWRLILWQHSVPSL